MPIFLPWGLGFQFPTGTNIIGTSGNDNYVLPRSQTTFVDMKEGNDQAFLSGTGDFFVDLGTGNDRVTIGNTGNTVVDGGAGIDRFYVTKFGEHEIDGGSSSDWLDFRYADEGVKLERGKFKAKDSASPWSTFEDIEYIQGSDHADTFKPGFFDWTSQLKLYMGGGDDVAEGSRYDDFIMGDDGDDVIRLKAGHDRGYGGDGDDYVDGGWGDDTLYGNDGRDQITAGAGADRVFGGDDADIIYAVARVAGDYYVRDYSSDYFDGGAKSSAPTHFGAVDTLSYEGAHGGITVNFDAGQVTGTGAGYYSQDNGDGSVTVNFAIDTFKNIERFKGSDFNDNFIGSSRVGELESFEGGNGADTYIAGLAEVHFNGGRDDSMDVADYSRIEGKMHADLDTGIVTIFDNAGQEVVRQRLNDVEKVVGTDGNDQMTGSTGGETLAGGLGNDLLNGRGGADVFEFTGADGFFGYDRVADFGRGDDMVSLIDLSLTPGSGGGDVNAFADLDTNGDGVLTAADAPVYAWADKLLILFNEGYIEFHDPEPLTADSFMFG